MATTQPGWSIVLAGAGVALCAVHAAATTVQDLVRIKGHEHNVLTGMGIVGLDGTGDTNGDSLVAARPCAELLRNYGNAVITLDELADADAFAIVQVTMEVPATGVREGDRLDIHVETMFNATTGGRLVVSLLRLPLPDPLAALDQLMVPVEDQIAIIYELRKTGALHAEIVSE